MAFVQGNGKKRQSVTNRIVRIRHALNFSSFVVLTKMTKRPLSY